jgi:hypothetical protein
MLRDSSIHVNRCVTAEWRALREYVLDRDSGLCQYCGQAATCVDHIVPWSKGGPDLPSNLVGACTRCNSRANARAFDTFSEKQRYLTGTRRFNCVGPLPMGLHITTCGDCRDSFFPARAGATNILCPWCVAKDDSAPAPKMLQARQISEDSSDVIYGP